jgi:phosphate transport system protein
LRSSPTASRIGVHRLSSTLRAVDRHRKVIFALYLAKSCKNLSRSAAQPGSAYQMAWSDHTTKAFDSDLQELSRTMAEMGGLAENQIAEAIEALTTRDGERAWRVIYRDATIDNMQRAIEERAVETIARRQPVANDLRRVVGILRIANELERIGDLAKNISKRIVAIKGEDMPRRSMRGFNHLADLVMAQLGDVLDSFARRDVAKAVDVWTRDQDVDRLCTSLFRELLAYMMEHPLTVTLGIHLLFCTKNLERMGDHSTNIAEAVYYMVNGQPLLRERPKADVTSMLSGGRGEAWSQLSASL